jgi:hypothetical protein
MELLPTDAANTPIRAEAAAIAPAPVVPGASAAPATASRLVFPIALAEPLPLSATLAEIARDDRDRLTIGDLVEALHDRSFSTLMVLFAVPNMIPFIPGSSTVLGLVLAILGLQLALGYDRVRLPRRLNARSFDRQTVGRVILRLDPWLRRFERMARPRYWPEFYRLAERGAGAVVIVLSLMVMLPIPLANGLPSLAICLIALGISERDGLWLGAGILVGMMAIGVVLGFFLAGFAAAEAFW